MLLTDFIRSQFGSNNYVRESLQSLQLICTMATLNKLIAEIGGSIKLVHVQEQLGCSPERLEQVRGSIVSSLCEMVKTLSEPLTNASASQLLEHVLVTPFSHTHKTKLSQAIEAKLMSSTITDKLSPTEKQGWKSRTSVLKYFTANDWKIMGDKDIAFNDHSKIVCAVGRLTRGGMRKPSPPVCADIIAALAAAVLVGSVDEVLLYQEVHNLGQTFANFIVDPAIDDLPVVRTWPDSPEDLPSEVLRAMYPEPADQPVIVTIQRFAAVRKVTSCRDTNTAVRDKIKKSKSQANVLAIPQPLAPQQVQEFNPRRLLPTLALSSNRRKRWVSARTRLPRWGRNSSLRVASRLFAKIMVTIAVSNSSTVVRRARLREMMRARPVMTRQTAVDQRGRLPCRPVRKRSLQLKLHRIVPTLRYHLLPSET